jgi:hypothetical protein
MKCPTVKVVHCRSSITGKFEKCSERWLGESGHRGKWIVGLNAARMAAVQEI